MENLNKLYNKVFDTSGEVKLCGREACKDLIIAMQSEHPNIDFGDSNTGIMNVNNIQKYYKQ